MRHDEYGSLDLMGGSVRFLCDDDEDMIRITYSDGMLIDVGKSSQDGKYYITVVPSDDLTGWSRPLLETRIDDKRDLIAKIQNTVRQFRENASR